MLICGIKLTHDASVAVVKDGKLLFCVEVEKLNNNKRYSEIGDLATLVDILALYDLKPDDIDRFVLDGWHGKDSYWRGDSVLSQASGGKDVELHVAAYNEVSIKDDVLARNVFPGALPLSGKRYDYASYMHVTGHLMSAYATSPFAAARESAYVLVWDGGQYPRLYFVDPVEKRIINKGRLFCFLGTIYSIMGHYFGPYKRTEAQLAADREKREYEGYFGGYSIAGKLMSYIALGKVRKELLADLAMIYEREFEVANTFEHRYMRALVDHIAGRDYSDADVLLTLHTYLQELLLSTLQAKIKKDGLPPQNFCFTGGSALNIKWNSAIRHTGMFCAIYVPPFPNDCGSAIGAACAEMMVSDGHSALDWSVYSGPMVCAGELENGWRRRECDLGELAALLASKGCPIVFLNGAAELGPRALGNRSILAPSTDPEMKGLLNRIKKREEFRPVAPICMEEHAPKIFSPGSHDPHMLFDHIVLPDWRNKIPAIRHLDDTARLQTVNAQENPVIYRLLTEYYRLTGIPLLCNTSANLNGSGFFPDVGSAMRWGGVDHVYSDGYLYEKMY